MSQTLTDQADRCLGKRPLLQLHLGPPMPSAKRPCTMATRAATATTGTTLTNNSIPQNEQGESSSAAAGSQDWDAPAWDTSLLPQLPFPPSSSRSSDDATSVDESSKRALPHFPCPSTVFPTPTLEFDFRVAVTLKPEPSQVHGRAHKEITAVQSGTWSGSFGHGKIMAGGYDLGQARGFRPIRIVEGAFIMQTTDEVPATLEMRTRGSLSGPCDVLDTLLSPRNPKQIDCREYGFRMFLTIKTTDKRYAEIVNCGLWVASGVWKGEELIIDSYRVA